MRRRFTNKSLKEEYLTITAINDAEVYFDKTIGAGILYYRKGITWEILTSTLILAPGESVQFKGDLPTINTTINGKKGCGNFIINGECNVSGYCTSILYGEEYKVNELKSTHAFYELFINCDIVDASSLILPATTLIDSCYYGMFEGCTSLVNAPELPATTLVDSCYYNMFRNCTNLVNAPELPATTLVDYCYSHMFEGCTNLNYIKMLATDISASLCLLYWVYGVSPTGTFVKNKDATWDVVGTSGVPTGWTIEYE